MDAARLCFGPFALDPRQRRLTRDGVAVEIGGRYLDALILLAHDAGALVSKDRFMDEVWRGVPVTDEALTQCIRTLRRLLDDDAASPRYIATVPKHGYRFIAPVTRGSAGAELPIPSEGRARAAAWREILAIGGGGTLGGAVAGVVGGLAYGFDASAQPAQAGMGTISIVLVLVAVTMLVASVGAAGVALGIVTARTAVRATPAWSIAGGGLGGLCVGALAKLLGVDALGLLFGQSPGNITGGAEGLALGAAVGLACWLALWRRDGFGFQRAISLAAIVGGIGGMAIALLGGRMMGSSLALLAENFPGSRLDFGQLGRFFGEGDFGIVSRTVTGGLEGALFAACIVGGILFVEARLNAADAASLPRR
ncbi:MAG: transcriptional regulator [Sphingomonadales bacterium]|nr:transcriptional regulator [Sphingomonadales bacterium]